MRGLMVLSFLSTHTARGAARQAQKGPKRGIGAEARRGKLGTALLPPAGCPRAAALWLLLRPVERCGAAWLRTACLLLPDRPKRGPEGP